MTLEEKARIFGIISRLFGFADGTVVCRGCRRVKGAGVFGIEDHEPACPVRELMVMAREA